ncbi:MAG: class I SAM-dependent methyltransferase [Saprospiraceae bacterium]|nr:class I SAM-dependent methyltransferase [Saprospiraceae bacterium]
MREILISQKIEHNKEYHALCPNCSSGSVSILLETSDFKFSEEKFTISKCSNCQLIFTQNPPLPSEAGYYYKSKNYISHSDSKVGFVNKLYHLVRSIMLNRKRKILEKLTNSRKILDIGSGTGYFLNELKQHQWNVTGVEISEEARIYCFSKFNIQTHDPSYLTSLKVDEKFDIITLWHVFEHIYDFKGLLENVFTLLKDDGKLIVAVPNSESYDANYYKEVWAGYDVPRHLWHFSISSLSQILSSKGFNIDQIKRMPFDGYYVSLLSEANLKNRFGFINGFKVGFISHILSLFKKSKGSSLIYIISKTKNHV